MHYQSLSAIAFFLASMATAAPAPAPKPGMTLLPRTLDWTNQPSTEPKCLNTDKKSPDTATYTNDDIEAAIQAAVDSIINNDLKFTKSKTPYPHINTPGSGKNAKDSWADYNLPGCAQENSDKAEKAGFVEFPILRNKEVYTGKEGGPDRVLFQFVTDGDTSKTWPTQGFKNLVGNFSKSCPARFCGIGLLREKAFHQSRRG